MTDNKIIQLIFAYCCYEMYKDKKSDPNNSIKLFKWRDKVSAIVEIMCSCLLRWKMGISYETTLAIPFFNLKRAINNPFVDISFIFLYKRNKWSETYRRHID